MNTAVEQLKEARALIAAGWCQDDPAQDSSGRLVSNSKYTGACKFCAFGAMDFVGALYGPADIALNAAANRSGACGYVEFNDTPGRKKAQVLELFDDAIRIAEQAN